MIRFSNLFLLLCSIFLIGWSSCKKETDEAALEFTGSEVKYWSSGFFCTNLVLQNEETYQPEGCDDYLPFDSFWAVNLEAFDIPERYEDGDTFFIEFESAGGCEMENCDNGIACDFRHGIPIRLTMVKD